jgi:hypothetical protein
MRAYVLDRDTLAILGTLEDSVGKLVIKRRLWAPDTFTLTANRRQLYASQLQGDRLLLVPEGIPGDPSGGDQLVFLVDTFLIEQEGSAANDTITVSGSSVEALPRRVLPAAGQAYDPQTAVAAQTAMTHYVAGNIGASAAASRKITGFACAAGAAGTTISYAARYQSLVDVLAEIGQAGGIGWKTTLAKTLGIPSGFTFDVVAGTDRSASVFFDFDFDTLSKWSELTSLAGVISQVTVAGQGEGTAREIVTRPVVEPTGWDRREAFVDARDLAVGATTLLQNRGDAVLAANGTDLSLEATAHQAGSFRYGVDWFLGDIVTVRNVERAISYPARIVGVDRTVTVSDAASELVAILGRPFPGTPGSSLTNPSGAADKGMTPGPGTVTYAMIQNVSATNKVLGRKSAGAGSVEEIDGPAAGPGADSTIGVAGATGTKDTFAPAAHGHKVLLTPSGGGTYDKVERGVHGLKFGGGPEISSPDGVNLVVPGPDWTAPTLLNSWANAYGAPYEPAGYRKDAVGVVHLRGLLNGGAIGQVCFVLPAGYRPAAIAIRPVISYGTAAVLGEVRIDTSGNVTPSEIGGTSWFSLSGLSFYAA